MQVDQLASTLQPEEKQYVDMRKLVDARFKVRDLGNMLLSPADFARNQAQQAQEADDQKKQAQELAEANVRKLLSDAYKNIAQGQKNTAAADAHSVDAALALLEKGLTNVDDQEEAAGDSGGAASKA